MRILVSGSTGLLGAPLVAFLRSRNHEVVRLVRSTAKLGPDAIYWDPLKRVYEQRDFENFDAVIHLAGENIGSRWSAKKKVEMVASRCHSTALLAEILAHRTYCPKIFICASAVGYYGNRGADVLTEESPKGTGFLAELCQKWEKAAHPLKKRGARIAHTRFGAILSSKGGMLGKMLTPFRLGLGAKLGAGEQFLSWVALDDAVDAINHILIHDNLSGPVNVVAPEAVTQVQFSKALAKALHRPCFLTLPVWLLRLAFGEMADEMLLASQKVAPQKLQDSGYRFRYPNLEQALGDFV